MDEIRFDEGFKKLEEIVKTLEDSNTSLEDAFDKYREAMDISKNLKEKIFILPEDTVVLTGHGPSTTVGQEKKFNPFIR